MEFSYEESRATDLAGEAKFSSLHRGELEIEATAADLAGSLRRFWPRSLRAGSSRRSDGSGRHRCGFVEGVSWKWWRGLGGGAEEDLAGLDG